MQTTRKLPTWESLGRPSRRSRTGSQIINSKIRSAMIMELIKWEQIRPSSGTTYNNSNNSNNSSNSSNNRCRYPNNQLLLSKIIKSRHETWKWKQQADGVQSLNFVSQKHSSPSTLSKTSPKLRLSSNHTATWSNKTTYRWMQSSSKPFLKSWTSVKFLRLST